MSPPVLAAAPVDGHVHVIVSEITRTAAQDASWHPHVHRDSSGAQLVEFGGRTLRSAVGEFVDIAAILAERARFGIERVVLSPFVGLLGYDLEPGTARRVARIQNSALAAAVRRFPDRVIALGTVALQEPEQAARDLRSLMAEGELSGVEVAATVNGRLLGDDAFTAFWAAAEETGAVVFVHPTTRGIPLAGLEDYYLWNCVGNPLETTMAAAHLVLAGVLERHPQLRIVLSHGGGAIRSLRGRIAHAHGFQAAARARLREPVEASLRRFYFDTVTHDPVELRALIDFAGAEHVLLGSDHPFDMGQLDPIAALDAAGVDSIERAMVLSGTAARLFGG
ncbi:MAG: amidohydrolase [Actinomycetota bacterium]|nr:amidohydrolase [Actinomycetota bacterium]MDQ2955552.1 amidohydrolase [Actinomycetota bacterium]